MGLLNLAANPPRFWYLSDYFANLVEEGFDATIRVGELNDSGLIARKVGRARRVCVASPYYLTRRGRPRTPEELREH